MAFQTSILIISVFPEPIAVLKMLNRFHHLMIILAILTAKILRRVENGEKIIEKAN